ncbi:MAG: cupin domain-containing protein [Ignavibacteriaceae bacterium]
MQDNLFIESDNLQWEFAAKGIRRKILGYDNNLMTVAVDFEKGSIAAVHSHPHRQTTYVAGGVFEVEINGEKKILKQGDCFFIPPDIKHGVVCLEEGILVDTFTPYREDFIKNK